MIKLEHTEVVGWEHAIRGMRNPLNSWHKSDSCECVDCLDCGEYLYCRNQGDYYYTIGNNDSTLMKKLCKSGSDHRKFMRMIAVYVDITAPLYWWKEYDTYKVGTVANSCSTMHKIHEKEFTLDDFSHEHLLGDGYIDLDIIYEFTKVSGYYNSPIDDLEYDIKKLNMYRKMFLETKDKRWWMQMIQRLPSNYNQKRTVQLNYEVLTNMYHSRRNHKLDEWIDFCKWIKTLPYSELITGE